MQAGRRSLARAQASTRGPAGSARDPEEEEEDVGSELDGGSEPEGEGAPRRAAPSMATLCFAAGLGSLGQQNIGQQRLAAASAAYVKMAQPMPGLGWPHMAPGCVWPQMAPGALIPVPHMHPMAMPMQQQLLAPVLQLAVATPYLPQNDFCTPPGGHPNRGDAGDN